MYEYKTTFFQDFTIADYFGIEAVKETYKRAWKEWKDDTEYATELAIVLNHKIFQYYGKNNQLARLYDQLWKETDRKIMESWKGEKLDYYIRTTD